MKKWMKKGTIDSKENSLFDTFNSKKSNEDDVKGSTFGGKRKTNRNTQSKNSTSPPNPIAPKSEEKKLTMDALSTSYDEYLKQEENLSGVLNTKTLNLK